MTFDLSSYHLPFWFQLKAFFFFSVLPVNCYQPISLHPHVCMLSHVTPWTATHQASLPMDFSRQEYWRGVPFLSPGDLPDPGIEHTSAVFPALVGGFFISSATWGSPECANFFHLCAHMRVCVCVCSAENSVLYIFQSDKLNMELPIR